jgi:hypothetical protein
VINANVVRAALCEELGIKTFGGREFLEELVEDLRFSVHQAQEGACRADEEVATGTHDRLKGRHMPCTLTDRRVCVVCSLDLGPEKARNMKTHEGCRQCEKYMHLVCFESYHTHQKPVSGKKT